MQPLRDAQRMRVFENALPTAETTLKGVEERLESLRSIQANAKQNYSTRHINAWFHDRKNLFKRNVSCFLLSCMRN